MSNLNLKYHIVTICSKCSSLIKEAGFCNENDYQIIIENYLVSKNKLRCNKKHCKSWVDYKLVVSKLNDKEKWEQYKIIDRKEEKKERSVTELTSLIETK
ncbi:MAG: hypothetical protein WC648_04135 [Candidatus Paceibacterota bacterium]|jgi:hypothetical protein